MFSTMNCFGRPHRIPDVSAFPLAMLMWCNPAFGRTPQEAYLIPGNVDTNDGFGVAVAISGDTLVVGAPHEDSAAYGVNQNQSDNSASSAGAAYVYVRGPSGWTQQAYLKASNTERDDYFGAAVAVSGNTLMVGARQESSDASGINGSQGMWVNGNQASEDLDYSGAVYVFTSAGTVWSQQAYLKAGNHLGGRRWRLHRSGGLPGGQRSQSSGQSGYRLGRRVRLHAGGGAVETVGIFESRQPAPSDRFGNSIALSGTRVAGVPLDGTPSAGATCGKHWQPN